MNRQHIGNRWIRSKLYIYENELDKVSYVTDNYWLNFIYWDKTKKVKYFKLISSGWITEKLYHYEDELDKFRYVADE